MLKKAIKWSEDLSVGISEIDEDHKKLIDYLEQLFAASYVGIGKEQIDETLANLHEYTKEHFSREELLMEKYNFPSLEPHRFQHAKIVRELGELEERITNEVDSDVDPSTELVDFLRQWVIVHIEEHDKEYAIYLKEEGIEDPSMPSDPEA